MKNIHAKQKVNYALDLKSYGYMLGFDSRFQDLYEEIKGYGLKYIYDILINHEINTCVEHFWVISYHDNSLSIIFLRKLLKACLGLESKYAKGGKNYYFIKSRAELIRYKIECKERGEIIMFDSFAADF